MHNTQNKKARISNGFSFTLSAKDGMKAARRAENLEEIRRQSNRPAFFRNRKAYSRRDFQRFDGD